MTSLQTAHSPVTFAIAPTDYQYPAPYGNVTHGGIRHLQLPWDLWSYRWRRLRTHVLVMTARIVVLGAGTGGTLTANRLRRSYSPSEAEITVVDQDDRHVYQPGLLFVPFGLTHVEDIVRPRRRQLHKDVTFIESGIDHVDIEANEVHLDNGDTLYYDVLVVATGARLVPEETDGLTGPGWMDKVFTFYTPEGAAALGAALATFDGGRLVVNVVDMPIKCPVAPLEFCFLADWYFTERGIRDQVQITYATPLDGAFTKPIASQQLGGMLAERGIELVTEFNTGEVDGTGGRLVGYDDREVPFDLAVVIPLHGGAAYVGRSPGLGDELDFVPTDEHTLQSKAAAERLRHRRRRQRARLQSRLGHPLRRRDAGRQRRTVPRR